MAFVGIDTGGTFTDFVAVGSDGQALISVLSALGMLLTDITHTDVVTRVIVDGRIHAQATQRRRKVTPMP